MPLSWFPEEYRKPEYRVEVKPDREVYVNGDEVRFALAADYFFGAPVVGAAVRWTLFETRLRDEREWYEDEPRSGFGRMLESGDPVGRQKRSRSLPYRRPPAGGFSARDRRNSPGRRIPRSLHGRGPASCRFPASACSTPPWRSWRGPRRARAPGRDR